MYSRVTLLEVDTMRIGLDEAAALFRSEVAPRLREQEGYQGVVALVSSEGKGLIVTFWDREEAASDASGFASAELERFTTLFRAPPGRETYEVVFSDTESLSLAPSG